MHILVTNDDGPPSQDASPYVLPFVRALERAGHAVSVVLPHTQRSWIGKAHMVGQAVRTWAYWPDDEKKGGERPWFLVDSTPASCAQLGVGHLFKERGKVDLVISGPNFGLTIPGRNTTAVFALSSGTLGAAMEAAVCGYRSIALSFAFFSRDHDAAIIAEASAHGVRICEWLAANAAWEDGVRLYSINVPVQAGVSTKRVVWTRMLQNQWKKGSCFDEISAEQDVQDPKTEEAKIRQQQQGEADAGSAASSSNGVTRTRTFKWAPRFTDVFESVEQAGPGSDGWAVKTGETSVTALRANFMPAEGCEGEVKL